MTEGPFVNFEGEVDEIIADKGMVQDHRDDLRAADAAGIGILADRENVSRPAS